MQDYFGHNSTYFQMRMLPCSPRMFGHPGFDVTIVFLSWATGSISSGNMLAFDVIGKVCRIVGDAQVLMLLPMERR